MTLTIQITIITFIAVLILLLVTRPFKGKLLPRGGPRYKILLALLLLKLGSFKREDKLGFEYANRRVPALPGTDPEHYNDSFVFQASDEEGRLFMTRLGFRGGGREAEVWLWMVIDGKKYVNVKELVPLKGSDDGISIEAAGLSYHCLDDENNTWRIRYDGKMKPGNIQCKVDVTFTASSAMYHSGIHMDPMTVARAMSEMPWSREYFERLSSENQTRIEQGGQLTGTVTLGTRKHKLDMLSIRDHSWGKRDWTFINRYIWNVISFTEDVMIKGRAYNYMVYTTVDYGTTFKHLVSGWIAGKDTVLPIIKATDMTNLGVDGEIPEFFLVKFKPKGGPVLHLKHHRLQPEQPWMTHDGKFEVNEAYCGARIGMSGGVGMSEFGFTMDRGYNRPGDTKG